MSYLSASSSNTEVKRTFCTVKIVRAYVRILVAQIRKLTVSLKNGSGEVGLSTKYTLTLKIYGSFLNSIGSATVADVVYKCFLAAVSV